MRIDRAGEQRIIGRCRFLEKNFLLNKLHKRMTFIAGHHFFSRLAGRDLDGVNVQLGNDPIEFETIAPVKCRTRAGGRTGSKFD